MSTPKPDPRVAAEGLPICGLTKTTGHVEWVCINEPHDTEKQGSSKPNHLGYHPRSERHYYVPRYPMRPPPKARP